MNIHTKVQNNVFTIQYSLTEKEVQILKQVQEKGYIEFRDYEDDSLDSSKSFTKAEIQELISHDFLDCDTNAWHQTYVPSSRGTAFLNGSK